jgi:hypothetical protein
MIFRPNIQLLSPKELKKQLNFRNLQVNFRNLQINFRHLQVNFRNLQVDFRNFNSSISQAQHCLQPYLYHKGEWALSMNHQSNKFVLPGIINAMYLNTPLLLLFSVGFKGQCGPSSSVNILQSVRMNT